MEGAPLDRRAVAALLMAAVAGALANQPGSVETWLPSTIERGPAVRVLVTARLCQTAALLALYVVVPLVVARAVGARPRELGLAPGAN